MSTTEVFTAAVDVEWTRHGNGPGLLDGLEGTHTFKRAMWKQKNGKNMLILPSMDIDEAGHVDNAQRLAGAVETKLYLTDTYVTLDRNGIIRWAHEFTEGKLQASIMHLDGLVLPVVVETSRSSATWSETGGQINLEFVLTCNDIPYPVEFSIRFARCS